MTFGFARGFPSLSWKEGPDSDLTQEALVYPSVDDSAEVERWIEPVAEAWQSIVRGDSHDLYRIRPATPDDGARFVDWKATARSTGLMVREFTREDRRQVEVVFDPVQPRGPDSDEQFEKAVQMCAALVWRLHEMAAEVRFCSGEMGITIPAHSQRIYEVLPVVGGGAARRGGAGFRRCARSGGLGELGLSVRFQGIGSSVARATIEPGMRCPIRTAMKRALIAPHRVCHARLGSAAEECRFRSSQD